jgi:hypothetical protein
MAFAKHVSWGWMGSGLVFCQKKKTDYCSVFPAIFYEKMLSQWDCCMASLATV